MQEIWKAISCSADAFFEYLSTMVALLLKFICKRITRKIQVGRNFVLSKTVGGHAFIFIMGNTVYIPNIYKTKGPIWLQSPNCAVPLLSSYIRLARRLFPNSFPPCSLCLLPASTIFVESYRYDKLLQRGTTVDLRMDKSNTVQVMVKNGAKGFTHP